MANNLIICASGNDADVTTWQVADTTMVKLDGVTGTNVPVAAGATSDSAAYQPGIVTIDGLMINLASRLASPTGTMTVTLRNSDLGTDIDSVTINVADLSPETAITVLPVVTGSWHFFKFASSHALLAATNYKARVTTSNSTQVVLLGGASNNWNVLLRTTSNPGSLGAGDRFFCSQGYKSAGSADAYTLTVTNNTTTSFGAIDICNGMTENWTLGSATRKRHAGNRRIWGGATLNRGTNGSPITASSILEMDCSSDGQYGIEFYWNATVNVYGNSKANVITKLAADAASSATSLTTVDDVSAWLNTDNVVLASTTRTSTDTEMKALTAGGSGNTLTITALTNAHSGTSPTQGEVVNVTRNVVVQSVGANSTYVFISSNFTGTFNKQYVEHINMGSAATGKTGLLCNNATGTVNIQYCSIRSCSVAGSYGFATTGATANNITFSNNIIYAMTAATTYGVSVAVTSGSSNTLNGNVVLGCINGFAISDVGGTFTNNTAAGNTTLGITFGEAGGAVGTYSGNSAHSNGTIGLSILNGYAGTVSSGSLWRNSSYGLSLSSQNFSNNNINPLVISGATIFGNTTAGIVMGTSMAVPVSLVNFIVDAGTTLTQPVGIYFPNTCNIGAGQLTLRSCTFGATTAHSTGDFDMVNACNVQVSTENCLFNSITKFVTPSSNTSFGYVNNDRYQQTAGNWFSVRKFGTLGLDTVNFEAPSSQSVVMTPTVANYKLESDPIRFPVNSGEKVTVKLRVFKSATYNGNQPRLILKRNDAIGITSDTVLATGAAAVNNWEDLTGQSVTATETGTIDAIIDCDGTVGAVSYGNISKPTYA